MCRLKSGIILKDRIFVPEYDSHTEMLEELGIEDNYLTASKTFVRFELLPKDNNIFSNIDNWELNIDQDIVPDWYDEKIYKSRVIEQVKDWAKEYIHIGIDNLDINSGEKHYIKDCKNVGIGGNATVNYIGGSTTVAYIGDTAIIANIGDSVIINRIFDRAMIGIVGDNTMIETISGNAIVWEIHNNAIVKCIGSNAIVKNVHGSATIEYIGGGAIIEHIWGDVIVKKICNGAIVKNICGDVEIEYICGGATAIGSVFGWKNKTALTISENATFKDCETKTIYQSEDWKFVSNNNASDVERE